MPAGNYSGITAIGDDRYAVVCDKTPDGFYVFRIVIDTLERRIVSVGNEGFKASGHPNRDQEGIAYNPATHTLFISGEADNQVLEYTLDGQHTGRRLQLPQWMSHANRNYGLESLCYDTVAHTYWTVTERPVGGDSLLRLVALNDSLQPVQHYLYRLDTPRRQFRRGIHAHGVSELLPLGDGRLLVLEREVRVPPLKIGAYVVTRLYEVCTSTSADSPLLRKRLVGQWKTRMNLIRQNLANYEGMCVAHRLADGEIVIVLVADSQNRQRGLLRDWLKVATIR